MFKFSVARASHHCGSSRHRPHASSRMSKKKKQRKSTRTTQARQRARPQHAGWPSNVVSRTHAHALTQGSAGAHTRQQLRSGRTKTGTRPGVFVMASGRAPGPTTISRTQLGHRAVAKTNTGWSSLPPAHALSRSPVGMTTQRRAALPLPLLRLRKYGQTRAHR